MFFDGSPATQSSKCLLDKHYILNDGMSLLVILTVPQRGRAIYVETYVAGGTKITAVKHLAPIEPSWLVSASQLPDDRATPWSSANYENVEIAKKRLSYVVFCKRCATSYEVM